MQVTHKDWLYNYINRVGNSMLGVCAAVHSFERLLPLLERTESHLSSIADAEDSLLVHHPLRSRSIDVSEATRRPESLANGARAHRVCRLPSSLSVENHNFFPENVNCINATNLTYNDSKFQDLIKYLKEVRKNQGKIIFLPDTNMEHRSHILQAAFNGLEAPKNIPITFVTWDNSILCRKKISIYKEMYRLASQVKPDLISHSMAYDDITFLDMINKDHRLDGINFVNQHNYASLLLQSIVDHWPAKRNYLHEIQELTNRGLEIPFFTAMHNPDSSIDQINFLAIEGIQNPFVFPVTVDPTLSKGLYHYHPKLVKKTAPGVGLGQLNTSSATLQAALMDDGFRVKPGGSFYQSLPTDQRIIQKMFQPHAENTPQHYAALERQAEQAKQHFQDLVGRYERELTGFHVIPDPEYLDQITNAEEYGGIPDILQFLVTDGQQEYLITIPKNPKHTWRSSSILNQETQEYIEARPKKAIGPQASHIVNAKTGQRKTDIPEINPADQQWFSQLCESFRDQAEQLYSSYL